VNALARPVSGQEGGYNPDHRFPALPGRNGMDHPDRTHEDLRLAHVEADLVRELHLEPQVVHDAMEEAVRAFETASVRDFVPVLAGKQARERLRHPA
jgi:hypothetical protein